MEKVKQMIRAVLRFLQVQWTRFVNWFDVQPKPFQIISYGAVTLLLMQFDKDLIGLKVSDPYAVITVGYFHNVLLWFIKSKIPVIEEK